MIMCTPDVVVLEGNEMERMEERRGGREEEGEKGRGRRGGREGEGEKGRERRGEREGEGERRGGIG